MKAWLISGSSLKSLLIEANSFDEAIAKARKVNKNIVPGNWLSGYNTKEK